MVPSERSSPDLSEHTSFQNFKNIFYPKKSFFRGKMKKCFFETHFSKSALHTIYVGPVPTKDVQTPPLPLSFDPVFMEDVQCAETNGKSIFQFFYFQSYVKIHRKFG